MGKFLRSVRSLTIAALGIALEMGAGLLGRKLYPHPGMKAVFVLALILELAAIGIAMCAGRSIEAGDGAADAGGLARLERCTWIAWSAALANAMLTGFSMGAGIAIGKAPLLALCAWCGLFWLEPLLAFVLCWPSTIQPHSRKNELTDSEFPEILKTVQECAKKSGHGRRIRVFAAECGLGVFAEVGYDGILVSPLLLTLLTREEFKHALLHEFAHLTCADTRRELRWRRLEARCKGIGSHARSGWLAVPAAKFSGAQEKYQQQIEPVREREADTVSMSSGGARQALAAIAKAEFELRFYEEDDAAVRKIFEPELPRDDYMPVLRAEFERQLNRCGKMWLEELKNQAQCGSHPSFRERMESCGTNDFDAFVKETDPAWISETERVCAMENRRFVGMKKTVYRALRSAFLDEKEHR